ncbi:succinate--CoA ligase subunit alpha [Lyticum sinuosum]|uniref:Succinate--CoA ligase [ADP-forming] subunit alpha n=1 Tax=Lyticum sinuosum TaxID=1332059 RepID=A0AAE4VK74_9RICK|nr:succinate--CoA ligase subunit alpha [Lyticum sinuosum]MDZ5761307.1 Succinyl-CoA ligase subunit alpha [Lyticum sinuosum]
MGILIDKYTKVICQGFTGHHGTFHSKCDIDYGTKIVGGVTPGKGGTNHLNLPVFNTVIEAKKITKANASVIYVPPLTAAEAILEAIDAQIDLIICITEGIPIHDMLIVKQVLKNSSSILIGPNSPGIIVPGVCKIGIMPSNIYKMGKIGIVSCSGTLAYETSYQLTKSNIGQSTCIGIGGDPISGINFSDVIQLFIEDENTDIIIMIGEIGGELEIEAAKMYKNLKKKKPIVGFIAGISAPHGKRMGHAGAIISNINETAEAKINAMQDAGIEVARSLSEIVNITKKITKKLIY